MKKNISYLFLAIGVLGFITLIPGVMDGIIYHYFRLSGGDTINLDSQCYGVPKGWVIDSIEDQNQIRTYTLRSKSNEVHIFASVLKRNISSIPIIDGLKPIKQHENLFSIYELKNLAQDNSVRYWSHIFKHDLIVMGRAVETIENLSLSIKPKECK